jgi:hypothetical protein
MLTVVIDPSFDRAYCPYVLKGFEKLLGRHSLRIEGLGRLSEADPHPRVLRGLVRGGEMTRTFAVDLRDHSEISGELLDLVDVYGKTNLADADRGVEKCLPIGPTFGVADSRSAALGAVVRNAGTTSNRLNQRATLQAYRPTPGKRDYVFFLAWPWSKHSEVNVDRAALIESARELEGIHFEGGFVPIGRLTRKRPAAGLEDLTAARQYRHGAYLRHMRKSAFAVNTPAVHDCLGWKLGEFLALGKAVISLPLTRVMPGTFEHGEQVHFIENTAQAPAAMRTLLDDDGYRRHLEHGARTYWETYLEPSALVRRIMARVFIDHPLPASS